MTFLKIMAHIEINERKPLFEELCSTFKKKDSKFTNVLNYYKRNWLNTFYVESLDVGEEENSLLIARTNNVCECYNFMLGQKVAITNPRLSILIQCLLEEESRMREYITKCVVNVTIQPPIPEGFTVKENELPIASLSKLLQERKTSGYDLRSALKNQRFIEECKILVEKCY